MVKLAALEVVPAALVTLIRPVVAPNGTVAVICESLLMVYVIADVPLNLTADAPVKVAPEIVTIVPIVPVPGANELIVGGLPTVGAVTVKLSALIAEPPAVVTVIAPVVAPTGTEVLICPPLSILKLAATPLNARQ